MKQRYDLMAFNADYYLNKSLQKKLCFIGYIICIAMTLYVLPIYYFYDSKKMGHDMGETAMALYFGIIPFQLAIIIFVYTLIAGQYKRMILALVLMLLPTALVLGVMDGTVIEAVYGLGGAAIGAVGWIIHWAAAAKLDKIKAEKEKTREETEENKKG